VGLGEPDRSDELPPALNTHTWAPTAFWDASRGQYGIVYSANNGVRDVFLVNYTTVIAGLADSGWSSFRSYNFPDRYLRHSGYVLRIDPISASSPAVARQDATFQIVY
jgi:hypothetical protein